MARESRSLHRVGNVRRVDERKQLREYQIGTNKNTNRNMKRCLDNVVDNLRDTRVRACRGYVVRRWSEGKS